jgi:hypothetical protein
MCNPGPAKSLEPVAPMRADDAVEVLDGEPAAPVRVGDAREALRSDPAWSFLGVGAEDRGADWPVDESGAHPFAGVA